MKLFAASTVLATAVAFVVAGAPAPAHAQEHQHPSSGQPTSSGEAQQTGDFDLRFIDMTIAHHQMGLKMSQLAEQKAASPELKAKAREITQAQQQDLDRLNAMRSELYPNAPRNEMGGADMSGEDMRDMHGRDTSGRMGTAHQQSDGAPGSGGMQKRRMNMREEMNRLEQLSGAKFDLEFANDMILHNEMQVRMSERAEKEARHDAVRDFADKTIDKLKTDIADLQKFSGSASM